VVERLVILYPYGTVDFDDLPEKYQIEGEPLPEVITSAIDSQPHSPTALKVSSKANGSDASASANGFQQSDDALLSMDTIPEDGLDLREHLANLEYLLIKQALDEAAGVVAHAASRLKMRRTTLVEKMRKYGIQRDIEIS
jgi:sigma-54 specific flagellar transcriptional regulator A